MIQLSNGTFPCPIFNVRINFTATEVLFHKPRISTSISWDYPHGMFDLVVQSSWSGDVIWRTGKKNFTPIPQPRAALGVVSKLPAAFPSPKLNRSFRVYHISCYWMNIQVDPTSSKLASAMLNSKMRLRAVVGYGVKIFHPRPPNYVTRSPGCHAGFVQDCTQWDACQFQ